MSTEKSSHATVYQQAYDRLKKRICKQLQWDEMQYAEFQYKTGIAYLHWYLPCDDYGRKQLERSKLYWSWFKVQWNEHDMLFLETDGLDSISSKVIAGMYEFLHCPRALAIDVKPNSVVLAEIKHT